MFMVQLRTHFRSFGSDLPHAPPPTLVYYLGLGLGRKYSKAFRVLPAAFHGKESLFLSSKSIRIRIRIQLSRGKVTSFSGIFLLMDFHSSEAAGEIPIQIQL
jgi:hypothetical protein